MNQGVLNVINAKRNVANSQQIELKVLNGSEVLSMLKRMNELFQNDSLRTCNQMEMSLKILSKHLKKLNSRQIIIPKIDSLITSLEDRKTYVQANKKYALQLVEKRIGRLFKEVVGHRLLVEHTIAKVGIIKSITEERLEGILYELHKSDSFFENAKECLVKETDEDLKEGMKEALSEHKKLATIIRDKQKTIDKLLEEVGLTIGEKITLLVDIDGKMDNYNESSPF